MTILTRKNAERIITEVLYGLNDTDAGTTLLAELFEELGTSALTDSAVIKLAKMQELAENQGRFR